MRHHRQFYIRVGTYLVGARVKRRTLLHVIFLDISGVECNSKPIGYFILYRYANVKAVPRCVVGKISVSIIGLQVIAVIAAFEPDGELRKILLT